MDGQVTRLANEQTYLFDQQSMVYSHSQFLKLMTDSYIKDIRSGRKQIEDFYRDLQKLSTDDARSLLYLDNYLLNKSWENISYNSHDYKNLLITQLQKYDRPIERYNSLIEFKAKSLLPDTYLEWFKDDLRCSLFLISLIQEIIRNEAYKGRKALITGVTSFLRYHIAVFNNNTAPFFYIDNIIKEGDWKVAHLLSIKSTYLKGRTEDKDIKWLDVKNHDQIEWAYGYLDNDQDKRILLQGIFFPETIEEKYELILAHLDRLCNIESPCIGTKQKKGFSQRSYKLQSMKKAWEGQKQYQSKNNANDGSIKIYKKNQTKLEEIMAFSGFTANKLINNSIEQMYDQLIINNTDD